MNYYFSVMLSTNGLLDYLAELIWCFSCVETDQLSSKPLVIAHCVGALKICHSLSTNLTDSNAIFDGPVLGAVKSFLLTSCSVLLVGLKEEADYLERANARLSLFSPEEEIFIGSGTPRGDSNESSKFPRYPSSSGDRPSRRSEMESQNDDRENTLWLHGDSQQINLVHQQHQDFPAFGRESESGGLISPFIDESSTQGDQVQALIAQVTFEKTFATGKDDQLPVEDSVFAAHGVTKSSKVIISYSSFSFLTSNLFSEYYFHQNVLLYQV